MSPPSILFYVQHLLGIGHVFRATRVARALRRHGFAVHVIWGGTRIPAIDLEGLEMTWLEPVRAADSGFAELVRPDGSPAGAALLDARRDIMLGMLDRLRPQIVITETFPFGRRQMQHELVPFMQAARAAPWRPMTVSSIRDIMTERRKERRARESVDWARQWYDLVLVHGDRRLVPIEATLQYAAELSGRFRYTGIVTPDPVDLSVVPTISADVVVSAGGGAVGHALTRAAIGANRHSRRLPGNWLLVVGPERRAEDYRQLRDSAGQGMQVVRFVPDLARVMAAARVSVSRAGYNTTGDLLRSGCRAVLAPYEGGRETEQRRRAELFAARGLAIMLRDGDLSPSALGAAVDAALDTSPPAAGLDLDGARNTARILREEYDARTAALSGPA